MGSVAKQKLSRKLALVRALTTVRKLAVCLSPIFLGLTGSGCHSIDGMSRAEETGSYSVNVTAISRWPDVAQGLQPNFKLDETGALSQVLPVTSYESAFYSRNSSIGVGIGLSPGTPTESQTTTTTTQYPIDPTTLKPSPPPPGSTSTPTQQIQQVQTQTPAGPATMPTVVIPASATTMPSLPGTSQTLGVDPELKYELATALLQQVQRIDRQIKDAVKRRDMTPFVVTVKLNVQPIRRDLPVDLYYDLEFAVGTRQPAATGTAGQFANDSFSPKVWTNAISPLNAFPRELGQASTHPSDLGPTSKTPVVLPILNYDSIEGQLRTYSQSDVDAAALAVLAAYKQVGVSLNASQVISDMRQTFGQRANSLQSIIQLTDNAIRVRLGAEFSPEKNSETVLIGRERSISFVVLIPNYSAIHGATITVASRPHLRSSNDGLLLGTGENADVGERSKVAINGLLKSIATKVKISPHPKDTEVNATAEELINAVHHADSGRFLKKLDEFTQGKRKDEALLGDQTREQWRYWITEAWFDALGAPDGPVQMSDFSIDSASLAQWPRSNVEEEPAASLVADDKNLVLTLRNCANLQFAVQPVVTLVPDRSETIADAAKAGDAKAPPKPDSLPTPPLPLQASSVAITGDGTGLQAVFFRPKALGTKPYTAYVDFDPPVQLSEEEWQLAKLDKASDVQAVVASLKRLQNGRFRLIVPPLSLVGGGPAPDPAIAAPQEPTLSTDQSILRLPKAAANGVTPSTTFTFHIDKLPANASDSNTFYAKLHNASFTLSSASPSGAAKTDADSRIMLLSPGTVILTVQNAVPEQPVTLETYQLKDGVQISRKIHAVLIASP